MDADTLHKLEAEIAREKLQALWIEYTEICFVDAADPQLCGMSVHFTTPDTVVDFHRLQEAQ